MVQRVTVLIAIAVLAAACSSSSEEEATTTAAQLTTTSTTVPPTSTSTTVALTTTTTVAPTTTSSSTTTSTTIPEPEFGFFLDGLGVVDFGATPEEVTAALEPIFGLPTSDSGWIDEVLCPGTEFRALQFGEELFDFRVLFTNGDLFVDGGVGHFFTYRYKGATDVPVTPPDLTVGTKVSELQALYPSVIFLENPFIVGATVYRVDGESEFELLTGGVTGEGAGDLVTSVQGGIGCGE